MLRELVILRAQIARVVLTIKYLLDALDVDERFATLERVKDMRQLELFENVKKEGPAGLPDDPFSVLLVPPQEVD